MTKLHCNILYNQEIVEAEIEFDQKINSINVLGKINKNLDYVLPGFIDLHVHGGGGSDVMDANNAVDTIAKTHVKFGTTSFLPTTMTASYADLEKSFLAIKKISQHKGAKILGVHLEGPFINDKKLGAQPNNTRMGNYDEIKKLHQIFPIKVITLAPEIDGHLELIKKLTHDNFIVQLGHTNADFNCCHQALSNGAKSFTHLFNAMSPLHHREPGAVGTALLYAKYSELIPDLEHVHPEAIKLALKNIPSLYFVTDATSATAMPDGEYNLGTQKVFKCVNGVKLADGTLAGSALTMHQAFLNLIKIGLNIEEASRRLSQIPAELISCSDRGIIKENYFSDLIVLDQNLNIKEVYVEGEKCV